MRATGAGASTGWVWTVEPRAAGLVDALGTRILRIKQTVCKRKRANTCCTSARTSATHALAPTRQRVDALPRPWAPVIRGCALPRDTAPQPPPCPPRPGPCSRTLQTSGLLNTLPRLHMSAPYTRMSCCWSTWSALLRMTRTLSSWPRRQLITWGGGATVKGHGR